MLSISSFIRHNTLLRIGALLVVSLGTSIPRIDFATPTHLFPVSSLSN